MIERNNYEPYGAIIGNTARSGIGYAGHVMDGGTGLTYMQQRYYDQSIGRFLSVDPVTADVNTGAMFNRFNYANNNPYRYRDPDGRIFTPETIWDGANVVMDVASLSANLAAGNYGGAAVDAVGLIVDGAATVVPGVPGGAGTAIKAFRGADAAVGAARSGGKAADAAKNDPVIYRMGTSKESPTRLGNKAAEAESAIGRHGVSGSTTKPSGPCSSASCSSLESAGFKVTPTPTRGDPGHVTIELPKPVTKEVAEKFNATLGR